MEKSPSSLSSSLSLPLLSVPLPLPLLPLMTACRVIQG
jgi:hypothetical protein